MGGPGYEAIQREVKYSVSVQGLVYETTTCIHVSVCGHRSMAGLLSVSGIDGLPLGVVKSERSLGDHRFVGQKSYVT